MIFGPALALALSLAAPSHAASEFDKLAKAGLKSLRDDDPVAAEIALKRAARLKPDNADIHAALALALSLAHERAEALDEYRTALRLDRRYVESRKVTDVAGSNGWLKDAPGSWDGEQDQLAIEVFNAPKMALKTARKASIEFPKDWIVEGNSARPDNVAAMHARLSVEGGRDAFNAEDAADWFDKAREASPTRFRGYKELGRGDIKRGGAAGIAVRYLIHPPRYREDFQVFDEILLKNGEYRRAVYEAPESEFDAFFKQAFAAIETLKF